MEKITILTSPTSKPLKSKLGLLYSRTKNIILKTPILEEPLGNGPKSVRRSLVAGLEQLGVNFNYNPKNVNNVGKIVMVLSNIEALKQAIKFKRNKKIKRLLAGPNLVVFSSDFNHIIASPEIDICLVPSEQVAKLYVNDDPTLINRTKIWYAGVDENFWKPNIKGYSSNNILIYNKNANNNLRKKITMLLKKYHWNPIHIKYGCYTQDEYKSTLLMSKFAIFLSNKESQGISLAESWAMDVPTLTWNPKKTIIQERLIKNYNSAPYLNNKTGVDWSTIDELENILITISYRLQTFNPRQWVIENMTDIKSAKLLLRIIKTLTI